jgi:glycosyltransferase involved in cell wall biosynthesis
VPELIENDVNGLLVPPKDPLALRAVLLKLIDDPDLRARLGAKGRNIIERGFSIGDMAGATVELYLRGLHERRHA